MTKLTQKREEIIETLYLRAEEIFLQSMLLTRRGIGHGFAEFSAHVQMFRANVKPVDTNYGEGEPRHEMAEITIDLDPFRWSSQTTREEEFSQAMAEIDTYVTYLDHLLALGKPVTSAAFGGAT